MSNHTSPDDSLADGLPEQESPGTTTNNINYASATPQAHSHPAYPGASVYTPTSIPSVTLNPRSCVTCRRRKVRCDKHMPCSNCRRAQIPCIFPAPGRAPRRPRPKDPNATTTKPASSEREIELMKRLRKLEGIVEDLSGQIEVETARNHSSNGNSPEAVTTPNTGVPAPESNQSQGLPLMSAAGCGPTAALPGKQKDNTNKKFGRLVINDHGKTRYVSSAFWSKITDELDAIRDETQRLTDDDSDISDNDNESIIASIDHRLSLDHHSFVFGYRSADVDLRKLHPLPSQIPFMWQVYQENVDPIVKVLHAPTMSKLIKETRSNLESLTPANEALMFAIYYAAVTSLDDDDVKLNFGVDKGSLITKYRFALEQALAKAEFLNSNDLVVLQAFILFLVLVRRHDDSRFAWTLTGLAIRMSQSMGLHRDGSAFNSLTPFEIEMRRRLFWAICVLDLRSAEDQGTDLTIMDRTFDTQFPANIDDHDISPDTTEAPISREGTTDMTFSLIRYEICALARRIYTVASTSPGNCPRDTASTIDNRERALREIYERIETKYLRNGEGNPIYWVAANIARVICAKMTLVIYQPVLFPGPKDEDLSDEARSRIFNAATEIFEYNHQLNSDPRSKQWRWLFHTYTQWHAVAYVMMEVARRPWSAAVERAWAALNSVFTSPRPLEFERVGDAAVWLPLKKIFLKAKRHREAEIARLRADPAAARQLELDDRAKDTPKSFATIPGSVKAALANERWRKLVNAPRITPEADRNIKPPQQRATSDVTPAGAPGKAMMDNGNGNGPSESKFGMDVINNAMAQTAFSPENLWPISFNKDFVDAASRPGGSMFGYLVGDPMPKQDANFANFSQSADANSPTVGSGGGMSGVSAGPCMQSTPLVDAMKSNHPPPWMWPDNVPFASTTSVDINGTNGGVLGAQGISRTPEHSGAKLPIRDIQPEDIDVDMGEDFNWQDWGQSLMESTGSALGGVWSAHDI